MKSPQQQLREAAVVAASTAVWTTAAVFIFDRMPVEWIVQSRATFAPVVGVDVASWFLPVALVILVVAGWLSTLGLIFQVLRWHIREDEATPAASADDEHGREIHSH